MSVAPSDEDRGSQQDHRVGVRWSRAGTWLDRIFSYVDMSVGWGLATAAVGLYFGFLSLGVIRDEGPLWGLFLAAVALALIAIGAVPLVKELMTDRQKAPSPRRTTGARGSPGSSPSWTSPLGTSRGSWAAGEARETVGRATRVLRWLVVAGAIAWTLWEFVLPSVAPGLLQ